MTARALVALAALVAAVTSSAVEPVVPAPAAAAAPRRLEFPAEPRVPARPVENPHDYEGKPWCQWCHEGRNTAVKGGDPIALCTQCHPPSTMKHPFGIPAKRVPPALPVGAGNNNIFCHTCHDPHDVKAHRKGLRLEYMSLCEQCHAGHGAKGKAPSRATPPASHRAPPASAK